MLHEYIVKLQKELEPKEPLGGADDLTFSLSFDENVISIVDQAPGFRLSCNLGGLPSVQVEEFMSMMLRANLFGQATHFAALGLDETGNNVMLHYHHPQKASYQQFHNAVEDFINVVDFWKNQIKSHPAPA